MTVPNTFANATTAIPLVQLDQNFNTGVTLGNTTVFLGNTTTTLGNVTLTGANVSASTLSTSGNTTIFGTTTNDNAAAGYVGEYISATLASGSAVSLSTGTAKTVTSISLTAGDWDVSGVVNNILGATTNVVAAYGGISTTADTLGADNTFAGITNIAAGLVYGNALQLRNVVPTQRISIASTTTVYLIGYGSFSVSTLTAHGLIRARRVR